MRWFSSQQLFQQQGCFIASLIAFGAELRPPLLYVSRGTFDTAALVASGNVPVEYLQMYLKSLHGNQLEDCEKGRDDVFCNDLFGLII